MRRFALMASMTGLGLWIAMPLLANAQDTAPPPPPPPAPYQETAPPPPPPGQPIGTPPSARSNHVEVGAFADYLRFAPGSSVANFVGVGGRLAVNMSVHTAIEGEMSYDFARNYTNTYGSGTSGGINTTFVTTGLRPLTALFGPKFDLGSPSMHAFVTGKVGFINFHHSNPNNVGTGSFGNSVGSVGGPGTHVAFYPGGGIEGFWGFFGLRAEAGDEIYLDNGTYNNLRVTFGPVVRF